MSENEVQRILGRLEQIAKTQHDQIKRLEMNVEAMQRTLDEARGGWRLILFFGGGAAAFGALLGNKLATLIGLGGE